MKRARSVLRLWDSIPAPLLRLRAQPKIRVELYLDASDPSEVSRMYAGLRARRDRIEEIYGSSLSWEELPTKRASRVADYADGDIVNDAEHDGYMEWFVDSGTRLRRAIMAVADEVAAE